MAAAGSRPAPNKPGAEPGASEYGISERAADAGFVANFSEDGRERLRVTRDQRVNVSGEAAIEGRGVKGGRLHADAWPRI